MAKSKLSGGKLAVRLRRIRLAYAIVHLKKNYTEAMKYAGYSELTAVRDQTKIIKGAHKEIGELMDMAGLTRERLLEKSAELLEAKQYQPVKVKREDGSEEIVTWSAPDPRVQEKVVELGTEMQGMRRWGAPGTMGQQNLVQVNVSFGGNAQGVSPTGQQAMPVQVKVAKALPPGESEPPDDVEPNPEEEFGSDPTGHPA